jgi:hypothetical protein
LRRAGARRGRELEQIEAEHGVHQQGAKTAAVSRAPGVAAIRSSLLTPQSRLAIR